MRIERFPAGMGIAVVLLGVSCGAPDLQPKPVPDVVFPLVETARVIVKGPLIPRLTAGPGGLLLAASTSGELQALNPAAKSVAWTHQEGRSKTAPVVDGDKIFWAAEDGAKGKIVCLDPKGHVLWHRLIDEPAGGDLRVVGGKLVFQEGDKALSALNAADGTPAWRDPASLPEEWTADGSRIVVRTADGRLRALDPEGRLVREIEVGENAAGPLGLFGNFVYFGYDDGRFGAIDLATGRKKWQMRLGGIPAGPPVSDGRVVLVALSNHVLAALRAKRGDLLWWKP
ncbi:MAG: PQQ-like beta-propeller repeat protein, partial [Candidatus Aminicenantes bacterium]|nr:PQQ-like beta-propeller repeat protein [Candidatus Aminicenantes bacterium]